LRKQAVFEEKNANDNYQGSKVMLSCHCKFLFSDLVLVPNQRAGMIIVYRMQVLVYPQTGRMFLFWFARLTIS